MTKWRIFLIFSLLFLPPLVFADVIEPLLNKISLQLSAEKWATTATARVVVNLDAALDKFALANINDEMLKKLQAFASNEWHITSITRNADKSGLEQVHIEAEARIPANSLGALRDKAKALSKPGETYTIANIDFTPTLAEMELATADARNQIYNNAKQEVAKLNELYPEQHFFLYSIDFSPVPTPIVPLPLNRTLIAMSSVDSAAKMAINSKVTLTANAVVAAATPVNYQTPSAAGK